uniref:Capsid protein n=1 Tax=Dromedary picobirnavirus TaxID=1574421 RepID=A0A0A1EIT4_9VIRU|nr:capsid protein [Dromedary picobirnavirus]
MANYRKKREQRKPRNDKRETRVNTSSRAESLKDSDESVTHKNNDASWYAQSAQLLSDTASLSFNDQVGTIMDLGVDHLGGYHSEASPSRSVPGVMAFNVVMTPGLATSGVSAVNIAAKNMFSYVRHANSGMSNYDSSSLMMYVLAMDSIYAIYNDLKRLYGMMTTYSSLNRYMPHAVVAAMGYDFNDFQKHLLDLRAYLNVKCNQINTRAVPDTLSYLIRHSWLFSNVFKDTNVAKSQLYVFRRANYFSYNEFSEPAKLINTVHPNTLLTFADVTTMFDNVLAKVIESQDFAIMSGDIVKAYGDRLFRVSPVTDDYNVIPVYSEEVLQQIHNTTILPTAISMVNGDIRDDVNGLKLEFNPYFNGICPGLSLNKIIDMLSEKTDPANVMVATRLAPAISEEIGGGAVITRFIEVGSECIAGARVYYYTTDGSTAPTLSSFEFTGVMNVGGASPQSSALPSVV